MNNTPRPAKVLGHNSGVSPNITQNQIISNRYILFLERLRLVKMLVYKTSCLSDEFTDKRHRAIASCLSCFLDIFPVQQHSAEWLLFYLAENSVLGICGGEVYIREIFGGVGGGDE
jgi:hypothetical protein